VLQRILTPQMSINPIFPMMAAAHNDKIKGIKPIPNNSGFDTQIIPAMKISESPGRKKPINKPVSANTTKSNNAKPP